MKPTILAIANQKGGVGKTTTTANLGIGLARQNKRVLLVDCDPQASLTISLGYPQPDELPETSAEGKSIFAHDPRGKVAQAYTQLTWEVLRHEN